MWFSDAFSPKSEGFKWGVGSVGGWLDLRIWDTPFFAPNLPQTPVFTKIVDKSGAGRPNFADPTHENVLRAKPDRTQNEFKAHLE